MTNTWPVAAACLVLSLSALTSCSTRQGYATTQAWQRNQCLKINDAQERQRCLRSADTSYDSYQKQAEDAKPAR